MASKKKAHTLSSEERNELPDSTYAFPKEHKEPLEDASHVRNAIARFDQVKDVSPAEKKAAFTRIKAAAKKTGVKMTAKSVADLGKKPPAKKAPAKKAPAKKSLAKNKSTKL